VGGGGGVSVHFVGGESVWLFGPVQPSDECSFRFVRTAV